MILTEGIFVFYIFSFIIGVKIFIDEGIAGVSMVVICHCGIVESLEVEMRMWNCLVVDWYVVSREGFC